MQNIKRCRVCGSKNLKELFDLGPMAYTGFFPKPKNKISKKRMSLVGCSYKNGCGLVQLKQVFNVEFMYGDNYGYRSGLNKSMVNHLQNNISLVKKKVNLKKDDTVLDIGSNDGTSLSFYEKNKFKLIGIDPTSNKFKSFYRKDAIVVSKFFNKEFFYQVSKKKAKIITSFSMFYDLPSPLKFSKDVYDILDDKGVWMLEQSYLPSMIKANSFDTICHEHLEYYPLKTIDWISKKLGFKIIYFNLNDVNGGSFQVILSKDHKRKELKNLKSIINKEKKYLNNFKVFNNFKKSVDLELSKLNKFLKKCKKEGKVVTGLGASTKGNVLLQYLKLNSSDIKCIGDVNEYKHGRVTPGTKIPITSDPDMFSLKPDYILVLPWHFKKNFKKSYKGIKSKLIFPLPKFNIS